MANDEYIVILKEAVVARFKIWFFHSSGETGEIAN
jgi:hypothetical protein